MIALSLPDRHQLSLIRASPPPRPLAPTTAPTLTAKKRLHGRKFIRLHLPGFTRGERNGTAGEDLGFNNEDDIGNDALVWNSDT